MNKKISLGLTIALIIASVTATFAITMSVSQRIYNKLITELPDRSQMYSAVEEIDKIIRTNYYGDVDEAVVDEHIAWGYTKGLKDPYSYFMSAEEYGIYSKELAGRSAGIGIETELNPITGYLNITEVYPNSPAQTQGLKKGDQIVAIGGETVTKHNHTNMIKQLSGMKLTSVSVTFRHDDVDKTVNIVMGYTNQTVSYQLLGTVGYIKISAFYKTTLTQLEKAMHELKDQGAKNIVFDVRGTSKGTIEYAVQVIDHLVPVASDGNKAIATLVDKKGKTVKTYASDADDVSMPMCVLINGSTSGLGELFACDLRDFGKAVLVGTTTAGNAGVQELFTLKSGAAVVLTTSKVIPYVSESYDGVGVKPDNEVKLNPQQEENISTLSADQDAQLQSAISMLADGKGSEKK